MATENRTEQATPRKRQKARERGQITRSRELPAALVLLAVVLFLQWQVAGWSGQWRSLLGEVLATAARGEITSETSLLFKTGWAVIAWAAPPILLAWVLACVSLVAQGGLVVAPVALTPDWGRLGAVGNLKQLVSLAGLSRQLKSLVPLGVILYLCVSVFIRDWNDIVNASGWGGRMSLAWMLSRVFEVSWKASLVLLIWSGLDYFLQHLHFERGLRMTREEVRDEMKELEGHPAVRGRIRRVQREIRRRRMLRDVSRATVVITNPSHYAVALEYQPEIMAAPVVVAKGQNLLAQQIKQLARWNEIPIVENPPLAQALYKAAEVGQAIPAKLYAAVAEILAFLYRAQGRMRGASASGSGGAPAPGAS